MALIEYVGKKPCKADNVAGTETFWSKPGDVQEVADPEAVEKLLKHPGIWRLVPAKGASSSTTVAAKKKPTATEKAAAAKKKEDEDTLNQLPPIANFARMGKDRIEQYARTHLGYEVNQRHSIEKIRADAQKAYNRIVGSAK